MRITHILFRIMHISRLKYNSWIEKTYSNKYYTNFLSGFTLSQHIPISSYELLSLPETNMKNKGSGNVTSLKFENRTRTQSHTRSPIWRSLISKTILSNETDFSMSSSFEENFSIPPQYCPVCSSFFLFHQVYLALQIFVPLFLLTFPFYRALGLLVMLRRRCHFRGVPLRLSGTLSIAFLQANSECFQMAIGY